nr:hypothetical protein I308_06633 [Cryptococcus tetragattii IND107]
MAHFIQEALRHNASSISSAGIYEAELVPVPRTHQVNRGLNSLRHPELRQWYEYYHGEVPEGGPFGEAGAALMDRQLREAILSRLIPYVLRDSVLSD